MLLLLLLVLLLLSAGQDLHPAHLHVVRRVVRSRAVAFAGRRRKRRALVLMLVLLRVVRVVAAAAAVRVQRPAPRGAARTLVKAVLWRGRRHGRRLWAPLLLHQRRHHRGGPAAGAPPASKSRGRA